MITPFWRTSPFTDNETRLLEELFKAHDKAARRQNISSVVLQQAYVGSGDFTKAVTAALGTLGGLHAPLIQTYEYLIDDMNYVPDALYAGEKIPGWGNSFVKGKPDPDWFEVDEALRKTKNLLSHQIDNITLLLHKAGKKIYPNPSCYTAATAISIQMPKEICHLLLLYGRLPAWAEIIHDITRKTPS